MYLIIALLFVFMGIYIFLYNKINRKLLLVLKMITSFCFVLLGFYCFFKSNQVNDNYAVTIIIGLLCGFFGDFILGIRYINYHRRHEYFILGLLMFFLGHIFYNIAIFEFLQYSIYLIFLIATVFATLILLSTKLVKIKFRNAKILIYLYILFSALLLTFAIANRFSVNSLFTNIILIGVAAFVLSDYMLCCLYFKKLNLKIHIKIKALNIIFYYLGQTLIALSILYL